MKKRKILMIVITVSAFIFGLSLFYIDNKGKNTLRLGLSRLSDMDIEKGIKIIGETIDELNINA